MNYETIVEMNNIRESIICRFIINLPAEELLPNRIFFHLQAAYWYYHDHIYRDDQTIEKMNQNQFYYWITQPISALQDIHHQLKDFLKQHKEYSRTIALYGAILVNEQMDSLLVVMNYRQTVYSFPKGKVNQNEDGVQCAIREVWEEVGYRIGKSISANDYVEFTCEETGQRQRLYIVLGVNEKENFKTNTRFEIGKIEWIKITDIMKFKQQYSTLFPYMYGITKYISHAKAARSGKMEISPQATEYLDQQLVEELIQEELRPRKIKKLDAAEFKLQGQAYTDMDAYEKELKQMASNVIRKLSNDLKGQRVPVQDYGIIVWD